MEVEEEKKKEEEVEENVRICRKKKRLSNIDTLRNFIKKKTMLVFPSYEEAYHAQSNWKDE